MTTIVTRTDNLSTANTSTTVKGAALTHTELDRNFYPINISTNGTVEASKAIVVDANKDFTGVRNGTLTGTLTVGNVVQTDDTQAVPNRNLIFNGAHDVWQNDTTFSAATTANEGAFWSADHWLMYQAFDGASGWAFDIDRVTGPTMTDTSGEKFSYAMQYTMDTDHTVTTGTEYVCNTYLIEGYDFAECWGKKWTISFWVKASRAGTYCLAIKNNNATQTWITEYSATTGWTKIEKTIDLTPATITMDSNWGESGEVGVHLDWILDSTASGTVVTSTTDAWTVGKATTANQTSMQAGDTWAIAGLKVELGPNATPFVRSGTRAQEVAACQRFWQKSYAGSPPGTVTYSGASFERAASTVGASGIIGVSQFITKMQDIPTVTIYNPTTGATGSARGSASGAIACSAAYISDRNFQLQNDSGGGLTDGEGIHWHWTASKRLV